MGCIFAGYSSWNCGVLKAQWSQTPALCFRVTPVSSNREAWLDRTWHPACDSLPALVFFTVLIPWKLQCACTCCACLPSVQWLLPSVFPVPSTCWISFLNNASDEGLSAPVCRTQNMIWQACPFDSKAALSSRIHCDGCGALEIQPCDWEVLNV